VTTEKFPLELGFESLRDLPDIEALKDAGLIGGDAPCDPEGETEDEAVGRLLVSSRNPCGRLGH
jgi:hypothetical protein